MAYDKNFLTASSSVNSQTTKRKRKTAEELLAEALKKVKKYRAEVNQKDKREFAKQSKAILRCVRQYCTDNNISIDDYLSNIGGQKKDVPALLQIYRLGREFALRHKDVYGSNLENMKKFDSDNAQYGLYFMDNTTVAQIESKLSSMSEADACKFYDVKSLMGAIGEKFYNCLFL